MAGRKHRKRKDSSKRREAPLTGDGGASLYRSNHSVDEPLLLRRRQHSPPSPSSTLQDRVAAQHREIQSLLLDNQRLAATHVALKQELAATQQDISQLSSAAAEVKAQRDIEVGKIFEKSLMMDAEVRAIEAMSSDLAQMRADVQELIEARKDLASQLQEIESDLARVRGESQQVPAINSDIEAMRREIQRGRNAVEYEKKTHASNLEHRQTMDKNMIIMTREVENLRVELSNAEKRARAAAAVSAVTVTNPSPGYPPTFDSPEIGYGGFAYCDSYGMHQAGANAHPQYASGAALHHPYDLQHMHR
ncbi:protein FLC EXPRESSOR-like [Prosopis cineraria]|uniref:protein FLC EXPRESSOR-like n=1 Tax=Prosopis cineraria TaxID=364024 RepID=UPI00240EBC27|nr:protein FLC EXPRESSOR-like [Prosopis cineraria]